MATRKRRAKPLPRSKTSEPAKTSVARDGERPVAQSPRTSIPAICPRARPQARRRSPKPCRRIRSRPAEYGERCAQTAGRRAARAAKTSPSPAARSSETNPSPKTRLGRARRSASTPRSGRSTACARMAAAARSPPTRACRSPTTRTRSRRDCAARRCSKISSCARRSRTSITSGFPSASCTRAAPARMATSNVTSR